MFVGLELRGGWGHNSMFLYLWTYGFAQVYVFGICGLARAARRCLGLQVRAWGLGTCF